MIRSLKKKTSLFYIAIFTVLVLTSVVIAPHIKALLDPNDNLAIYSPIPNSTINGIQEIKFIVYDNESNFVPTKIEVLDSICNVHQRTIANSNFPSQNSQQIVGWDTTKGYSDGGALPDGNYCFSICGDYQYGVQSYNSCSRRGITIQNTVTILPPIITTSPPNLNLNIGNSFNYTVSANPRNGGNLRYSLTQAPSFLKLSGINNISAQLTANNIQTSGSFPVVIRVDNNSGGYGTQSFTINVTAAPPITPSNPPNQPVPPPVVQPSTPLINFVYPVANSVLVGTKNSIEWNIQNAIGQELDLEYRLVGTTKWNNLTKITNNDISTKTSYDWDVSKLDKGSYELHLFLLNSNSANIETLSPHFQIDNTPGTTTNNTFSISNLVPTNGAAITDLNPIISALINIGSVPTLSLNDITITLNNRDFKSNCNLKLQGNNIYLLSCQNNTTLSIGSYEVKLSVTSPNKPTINASQQWSFSIISNGSTVTNSDNVVLLGQNIARQTAMLCLSLIILFMCFIILPLVLILSLRNRNKISTYTTTTTTIPVKKSITSLPIDPFASSTNYISSPTVTSRLTTTESITKPSWLTKQKEKLQMALTNTLSNIRTAAQKKSQKKVKTNEPVVVETRPVTTASTTATTAEIMTGNNVQTPTYDLVDNPSVYVPPLQPITPSTDTSQTVYTNDNISDNELPAIAPIANTDSNTMPQSISAVSSVPVAQPVEAPLATTEELPDWLKTDVGSSAQPTVPTAGKVSSSNISTTAEDNDGSDPYGFGDYSIGEPQ